MEQYGKPAVASRRSTRTSRPHVSRPFCNGKMPTEAAPFPRSWYTREGQHNQQEVRLQRICLAGVCLALIFAGGEAQAADAKAPPMTASQKAAVDRAYAILQDTRDLQAMERLERRVPDQSRRGRRSRHF
jgi:hypothetical protein